MADDSGEPPGIRLKPFPPARVRPAWLRHRNVFRVALAIWLLAIVVRVVRDATGVSPTGTFIGFVVGVTVFLGLAVFGGYMAGTFLLLLAGIWGARVEGFRNQFAGRARPFARVREEGLAMVAIGLFFEGWIYWFAFLSVLGLISGLVVVGMAAWHGDFITFASTAE